MDIGIEAVAVANSLLKKSVDLYGRRSARYKVYTSCAIKTPVNVGAKGNMMSVSIFDIFDSHKFSRDFCFLCGCGLSNTNRSLEHVFPRWVQDKFNIYNCKIKLLNGTNILYRNLTIPCCKDCNNEYLSKLENKFISVLNRIKSNSELDNEDINVISAWVSKIYIGILWKELELDIDRSDLTKGKILDKELMRSFREVHLLIQTCRHKVNFGGIASNYPVSLYLIEVKESNISNYFNYIDNFHAHTAMIVLDKLCIIAIFDGGLHQYTFPDFCEQQFYSNRLHPIQMLEVFSKITYKSMLSTRVPYYLFVEHPDRGSYSVVLLAFDDARMKAGGAVFSLGDETLVAMPLLDEQARNAPSYRQWDQEEYAKILSLYTGLDISLLFYPPDQVRSFLKDNDDKFIDL